MPSLARCLLVTARSHFQGPRPPIEVGLGTANRPYSLERSPRSVFLRWHKRPRRLGWTLLVSTTYKFHGQNQRQSEFEDRLLRPTNFIRSVPETATRPARTGFNST